MKHLSNALSKIKKKLVEEVKLGPLTIFNRKKSNVEIYQILKRLKKTVTKIEEFISKTC